MMNSNELKNAIRDTAAQKFIDDNPDALAMNEKAYTYVTPVEIEGNTYYAKWGLTSVQMADTKVRAGFNPDTDATPAREAFESMLAKRAADKAAAEAAREQKKSKKKTTNE